MASIMAKTKFARLKTNRTLIQELIKPRLAKKKRLDLIKKGGKPFLQCVCECALNMTRGNIPLSKPQWKKLKRYKHPLTQLSKKKLSLKKKRTIVQQKGGRLLPLLFTPIIKALGGALF